jgi:hypothetical protein
MAEPSEDTLKLIGFSSNVVFKKSKAARIFSKGKTLAKENVTLKQLATAALGKIPLIGGALSAAAGAGAGIYQSDQLAKKAEAARIRCAEVEGMLNDDAAAEATKLASLANDNILGHIRDSREKAINSANEFGRRAHEEKTSYTCGDWAALFIHYLDWRSHVEKYRLRIAVLQDLLSRLEWQAVVELNSSVEAYHRLVAQANLFCELHRHGICPSSSDVCINDSKSFDEDRAQLLAHSGGAAAEPGPARYLEPPSPTARAAAAPSPAVDLQGLGSTLMHQAKAASMVAGAIEAATNIAAANNDPTAAATTRTAKSSADRAVKTATKNADDLVTAAFGPRVLHALKADLARKAIRDVQNDINIALALSEILRKKYIAQPAAAGAVGVPPGLIPAPAGAVGVSVPPLSSTRPVAPVGAPAAAVLRAVERPSTSAPIGAPNPAIAGAQALHARVIGTGTVAQTSPSPPYGAPSPAIAAAQALHARLTRR